MERGYTWEQLPSWYREEPDLLPHEPFYLAAFWDLTTERQIGAALGPIPTSKIRDYASREELPDDIVEVFVGLIRLLDNAYLKHCSDESARLSKQKNPT